MSWTSYSTGSGDKLVTVFCALPQALLRSAMVLVIASLAIPAVAERLLVRRYTVADGLASSHPPALVTDRDGFLWLCAPGGLSRFDGSTFVTFDTESGLPHSYVTHLLHTRSGIRWVATNGGGIARLESDSRLEPNAFTPVPVGGTSRSMHVNFLFESRSGDLLVGTDGGLFSARSSDRDPHFELVHLMLRDAPDSGLQIWSMAEDKDGDLWIGTSAGLVRLHPGGAVEHLPVKPLQGADHVWTTVFDGKGRLWLGHDLGLVVWMPQHVPGSQMSQDERSPLLDVTMPCERPTRHGPVASLPASPGEACNWTPKTDPQPLDRIVRPELQTADGTMWMTYRYGVAAFDGGRFHVYSEPTAHPRWTAGALAEDAGGDLWVASNPVARISRRGFVHYTIEDGLTERAVERVFRGADGGLFAITQSSHIHRLEGDRWTAVRPNVPADVGRGGRSRYGAVLEDHRGEWWIGTGAGLFRFPRITGIEELATARPLGRYTIGDGLAGDDVALLHEDARGDLWIARRVPDRESLTRWHRETRTFQRYGSDHGLPRDQRVLGLANDRAGGLWASVSGSGLARFDGSRFRLFKPGQALPPGRVGSSMHVDGRGGLWATVGNVVIHIVDPAASEPEILSYTALRDATVGEYGVLAGDDDGWIYLRSARGLARLRPADGAYHELGVGAPFTSVSKGFRDERGTLWFASGVGILRLRSRFTRESRLPPVWIGGVRIDGVSRPVSPMGVTSLRPLRLSADQRQVEIEFFGLGFGSDEPLRFQVRLDGLDESWSDPTSHHSVLYAGLGSGRYRFQVRAVNAAGRTSAEPASLAFTIPPPFWRRWWFLAALGSAVAALLIVFHRLRVARLLAVERVRAGLAKDLHDDLGASLARVSVLSELARRSLRRDPDDSERVLEEIGETSRRLVDAAGDIAFAVDPERVDLPGFVARVRRFAHDLVAGTDITLRFQTHGESASVALTSEQRRHMLAILKEGLHNAVRHADANHITVTLETTDETLCVELMDDGRGFEHDRSPSAEAAPAGQGLRNMRQRAREVRGQLTIDSTPGRGTRLRLIVPRN